MQQKRPKTVLCMLVIYQIPQDYAWLCMCLLIKVTTSIPDVSPDTPQLEGPDVGMQRIMYTRQRVSSNFSPPAMYDGSIIKCLAEVSINGELHSTTETTSLLHIHGRHMDTWEYQMDLYIIYLSILYSINYRHDMDDNLKCRFEKILSKQNGPKLCGFSQLRFSGCLSVIYTIQRDLHQTLRDNSLRSVNEWISFPRLFGQRSMSYENLWKFFWYNTSQES